MERRRVYHHGYGYRRSTIVDDSDPFTLHTETELHLEPIFRQVAAAREYSRALKHNRLVAQVPMTVYEQSIHEGWDEDDWKKWLNDSQNEPFRVWKGRV